MDVHFTCYNSGENESGNKRTLLEYAGPCFYLSGPHFYYIFYTSVTFAMAAVRSYISTVSRNSTAAAVFLRLHTLAVTFATAAVRRILIYGDRKTAAALRPLR